MLLPKSEIWVSFVAASCLICCRFSVPNWARNMARDSKLKAAVFLCLCCIFLRRCQGIWLNLPATGTKCVSEDIQTNVVVLADYIVVSEDHPQPPTISVKVTSPYGHDLHHTSNVTSGHFAFTTTESGSYLACFWLDGVHHSGKGAIVNLDWKVGIAARDWDSVAKKEKIEGVELDLRKLEGHVEAIHENLLYLKSREAEMRIVSETTNARVAWLSIMSLGVCIGVSCWQLWHLKRYFQKKKLI